MRIIYSLAFLLVLTGAGHVSAQSFTNGSLEAPATTACQNIYNFQFTTFMPNAGYAFGDIVVGGIQGKIYFYDASCNDGGAQNGSNYLGLASNDAGKVDAMSLRLTSALVANKTYTLTFYTKKSKSGSPLILPIPLEIGYTTDSLSFGTMITTVEAPATTSWAVHKINFRTTVPTRFITVRAVKSNTGSTFYSYTHVDNFSIAVGTAVTPEETAFAEVPHPNPFSTAFSFSLGAGVKMPCSMTLCDVTGRVVYEQSVPTPNVQVARGNISAGLYLLSVRDANGVTSVSRLIAGSE